MSSSIAAPAVSARAEFVELKAHALAATAGWEFELELGEGVTLRMRRVRGYSVSCPTCAVPITA